MDFLTLKMRPIRCPETSVKDYHSMLSNIPEGRRSHQHRGGMSEITEGLWFVIFVTNPNGPNTNDDEMSNFYINCFSNRLHAPSSIMLLVTATFPVAISTSFLLADS
jgi:hypothetical protein